MIDAQKVIVALDTADEAKINHLLLALKDENVWVKVGMEAFYALGPKVVYQAKENGLKVFLDLKLHDIPNTVSQGLKSLAKLPVDMLNIHGAGGKEMMMRSFEAISPMPQRPLLIAVTQLTSTSEVQMNQEQRIPGTIEDSVLHFAKLAHECQLDGVVSSPWEVRAIKKLLGKNFLTITPGIRPVGKDSNDQKRITTPQEALEMGTDFMVIGRPITAAVDPKFALKEILKGS